MRVELLEHVHVLLDELMSIRSLDSRTSLQLPAEFNLTAPTKKGAVELSHVLLQLRSRGPTRAVEGQGGTTS